MLFAERSGIYLEEHSLPVFALRTRVILGPGQGRVPDHVGHDVGQLVHLVHNLVHVDAVVVGDLLVVAIPEERVNNLGEKPWQRCDQA